MSDEVSWMTRGLFAQVLIISRLRKMMKASKLLRSETPWTKRRAA